MPLDSLGRQQRVTMRTYLDAVDCDRLRTHLQSRQRTAGIGQGEGGKVGGEKLITAGRVRKGVAIAAHLDYPCWCLLLAPQYPLRPDDTRLRVDGAVHDVDAEYMAAVWVRVLVPHADDDVGPWMAADVRGMRGRRCTSRRGGGSHAH